MASVAKGCAPNGRDAALLVAYLAVPNRAPRALPRSHSGRNATMNVFETASSKSHVELFASGALLAVLASFATAAASTETRFDAEVREAQETFDVPGVAIAVVHQGEIVVSKGFGRRSVATSTTVDQHTLFQIGSLTKAFTAASLAMLVEQGQLSWDDRVFAWLPEFG